MRCELCEECKPYMFVNGYDSIEQCPGCEAATAYNRGINRTLNTAFDAGYITKEDKEELTKLFGVEDDIN